MGLVLNHPVFQTCPVAPKIPNAEEDEPMVGANRVCWLQVILIISADKPPSCMLILFMMMFDI